MTANVLSLPADTILDLRPALLDIYHTVFTEPPYDESEATVRQFGRVLEDHVHRSGFKFVAALAENAVEPGATAEQPPEEVIGFAYGYTSRPGQWWYDAVTKRLDPAVNAAWMNDPFEVVELAVRPTHQGRGIGGRLHDTLLEGLPHRTAVLSTAAVETAATHLYRKRGWVILSDAFTFPGSSLPYLIMGLRLKKDAAGDDNA